jgi:hypothetical protein
MHQGCVAGANEGGKAAAGVVADIAKMTVGREAYYARDNPCCEPWQEPGPRPAAARRLPSINQAHPWT